MTILYLKAIFRSIAVLISQDVPHVLDSRAPQGPGMDVGFDPTWVVGSGEILKPPETRWFSPFCWGRGRISQGKMNKWEKKTNKLEKEGGAWARSMLQASVPSSGSSVERGRGNPFQGEESLFSSCQGPGCHGWGPVSSSSQGGAKPVADLIYFCVTVLILVRSVI